MTSETERHMIQIQETGDTPSFNTAWVDEQFPNSDLDSGLAAIVGACPDLKTEEELMEHVNPGYPCMPEHPPYSPPALEMDRLYRIQMDLANGLSIERNDTQALINEILRHRHCTESTFCDIIAGN